MSHFVEISGSNYTWDDYIEDLRLLTGGMVEPLNPLIKTVQELSTELNILQAQISGSSDFNTLKSLVTGT
jgi:hypothetical protein